MLIAIKHEKKGVVTKLGYEWEAHTVKVTTVSKIPDSKNGELLRHGKKIFNTQTEQRNKYSDIDGPT